MGQDRKLWLFMGGGVAVGAGVFGWYFLVGNKAEHRRDAQAPIAQWDAAWDRARTCLLGPDDLAMPVADALEVRTLLGETRSCRFADLARPEGMSSGVDEIEAAWGDAERAWHQLVEHQGNPAALGPPIEALDRARAALRRGADMEPAPARKVVGQPLAALHAGPALPGTRGLGFTRLAARGHALVGDLGDGGGRLIVRGPGDARVIRDASGVRAAPDGTWGAQGTEAPSTLAAGPLDATGALGAGAAVIAHPKTPVEVRAAIGGGAARAILTADEHGLALVRSHDGGQTWAPPAPVAGSAFLFGLDGLDTDPIDGATILHGSDMQGSDPEPYWLRIAGPDAAPQRLTTMTPLEVTGTCAAGTLWYVARSRGDDSETFVGTAIPPGGAGATISGWRDARIEACTRDAVAVLGSGRVYRCTTGTHDAGMPVPLDNGGQGFVDVFDGGGVVYARQNDDVIGVWRTGVDPIFVRAPGGLQLMGVAVWNGVPTFALFGDDGVHLAPLP